MSVAHPALSVFLATLPVTAGLTVKHQPVAAPPLPIARLVASKPVEEVAALLPRVYNLCPAAQGCAARLALGLELGLA